MKEVFRLRVRAWQARSARFPDDLTSWRDQFDSDSMQFVLHYGRDIAAAARLAFGERPTDGPDGVVYSSVAASDAPAPIAFMSRLVVCKKHAGLGLAEYLDRGRIDHARELGCRSLLVASSVPGRIGQLRKAGFKSLYESPLQANGPLEDTASPTVMALIPA